MAHSRKDLKRWDLQVFDQGITVVSNVDLDGLSFSRPARSTSCELHLIEGPPVNTSYDVETSRLVFMAPEINHHMIRQIFAFLVDLKSPAFRAVHGSGLVIGRHGVLMIGNHGTGKTTLATMYPRAEMIDDDILVVDEGSMYTVEIRPEPARPQKIDFVFLLEKSLPGGSITPVDGEIRREYSVPDAFPESLQDLYISRDPIKLQASVHRIGTADNPESTKAAIDALLRRS